MADGLLSESATPEEFFPYPKEEPTGKFLSQILSGWKTLSRKQGVESSGF